MEMGNARPELHVAQQSRRDKLRVHSLENFPNTLQHLDPYSSAQILNFSSNASHLPVPHHQTALDWVYPADVEASSSSTYPYHDSNPSFMHPHLHGTDHQIYQNAIQTLNYKRDTTSGHSLSLSLSSAAKSPWTEMKHAGNASSLQDIVASAGSNCVPGPLGPFTGYATILKSSRFLRPAQQLLDEVVRACEISDRDMKSVGEFRKLSFMEDEMNARSGGSGSNHDPFLLRHDQVQQKKATLLFMREEVTRSYRQYYQQMEMVVSSFESVAGLSSAIPFISLALKTVSTHFGCLKNAISTQLRRIKNALGEDLASSPNTGTSSNNFDSTVSRLKFMEQSFRKQKTVGMDSRLVEPQQHVWRPQRGLPERSVTILRAWLFEHFLHPYPTDTDKQMLATQTGLSRNQVSNWFINARVRVWKPMVEEIHMLETKSLAEGGGQNRKSEHAGNQNMEQTSNVRRVNTNGQVESHVMGSSEWNQQEKRARVDTCQIPAGLGGSLIGFAPYDQYDQRSVSLTLGLRNNMEGSQQEHHRIKQQFGGQIIHDLMG